MFCGDNDDYRGGGDRMRLTDNYKLYSKLCTSMYFAFPEDGDAPAVAAEDEGNIC